MKKLLVASIVVALVALSAPLWAQTVGNTTTPLDQHCDVSLDGLVTFTKNVTITQTRTDTSTTTTNANFDPKARADAEAIKNDLNFNNCMEVGDSTFTDNMNGSFTGFIGIGQSNQAAGQMNNQGNVAAVAFVSNNDAYSSALTAVGVSNKNNDFSANHKKDGYGGYTDWWHPDCSLTQTDNMNNSFNGFIGIGQSNQSAGSMNNQNNAVSVAAGVQDDPGGCRGFAGDYKGHGSMVAMAASELAMTNSCNKFQLDKATFTNNMNNSFNGFVGIGQSNQSAGNMNNQANVVSVAATVSLH
ncbi:MAG: hypothetical protein WC405_21305 [Syntrophales bacterium]